MVNDGGRVQIDKYYQGDLEYLSLRQVAKSR